MTTINVSTGAVSAIPMGYGPKGEKGDTGATGAAGPQGEVGPTGAAGADGADGKTILNGSGAPNDSAGADGDFYIDTTANEIYGPKAAGAWPASGVSLVGPKGDKGETGDPGSTGIPAGAVMAFAMSTAPTGWSECDGGALSRTAEATLYAAIGTTFGVGDGTTTFNKPDLRGEFIRGWAHDRAVDTARALGSNQLDATQAITGGMWIYKVPIIIEGGSSDPFYIASTKAQTYTGTSAVAGSDTLIRFDNSRKVRTSTEDRPRNIALMYCIKL